MTREEFEEVKVAGVKKWEHAVNLTENNWHQWMGHDGWHKCSFCDGFESCTACPIHDLRPPEETTAFSKYRCANEYHECRRAYRIQDFNLFHENATALRDRIAALKFEDLKQ